jgi:hypothetical protein
MGTASAKAQIWQGRVGEARAATGERRDLRMGGEGIDYFPAQN